MVRRREKLDAGQRQRHIEQWARRQAVDKTLAASQSAVPGATKNGDKGDGGGARGKTRGDGVGKAVANVFVQELDADPTESASAQPSKQRASALTNWRSDWLPSKFHLMIV